DVARTRQEVHLLTRRPGWNSLQAVRNERIYLTDASAYFNRPGPRIATGLEILAQILHPEVFPTELPSGAYEALDGPRSRWYSAQFFFSTLQLDGPAALIEM